MSDQEPNEQDTSKPGRAAAKKMDGLAAVLEKIAAMPEPWRAMGERIHAIIMASAPELTPRTFYGMPAYAKEGKVICFFRVDDYITFGFSEHAHLFDVGERMQPSSYAILELTAVEEERIAALVKRAVS
jgi:hypothetical protein